MRRDVQEPAVALREGAARGPERLEAEAGEAILLALPMLTADDVARLLRTSRRAVYAVIRKGQVPGVVRLGRTLLVRRDRLMRWLSRREPPT